MNKELDLNVQNYNYDELLKLFNIQKNDNRSNVLYKLDESFKQNLIIP
jgi:hypothetical protein